MRSLPSSEADESVLPEVRSMMIDEQWLEEAYSAARRANAFNPKLVAQMMKAERVLVSDMDEWCRQARLNHPCLYKARIFEGVDCA